MTAMNLKKIWIVPAVIISVYMLARLLGIDGNTDIIHILMLAAVLIMGGSLVWLKSRRPLEYTDFIKAVIIIGIVMRAGYMLYTDCMLRGHDMWELDKTSGGHAGYILTLIETKALPDTNMLQYYQQPLFYILGSIVSWVVNGILRCQEAFYLVDAAKIVSCIASCMTIFVTMRVIEFFKLDEKGKLIAISMVAFLPACYLSGGRVSCDALTMLFYALTFLYTLYWDKEHSWKNTIMLALLFGCAMMTKTSCGVMALFTLGIFIKVFVSAIKEKAALRLIGKYIVFGCISFPLGLWFSVRNYLLFGQSFSYVLEISKNTPIYTGDNSIIERMFAVDIGSLMQTPYADAYSDYNMPVYMLKSSLFGEFQFKAPVIIPALLLMAALILSVVTIAALIWTWNHSERGSAGRYAVIIMTVIYFFALLFYQEYQFGCSMDFRYFMFLIIPAAIMTGRYYSSLTAGVSRNIIKASLIAYSLLSCVLYMIIE